jgi:hypothetical protein
MSVSTRATAQALNLTVTSYLRGTGREIYPNPVTATLADLGFEASRKHARQPQNTRGITVEQG